MLGLTFSSKLDWGSYIISIAKSAFKKIGALIRSLKFLSPEVALYPGQVQDLENLEIRPGGLENLENQAFFNGKP